MKKTLLLLIAFCISLVTYAQDIEWEDVTSDYDFPEGLRLFHGTISGNNSFFAYYYEVDLAVPDIAIRPYLVASPAQVHHFSESVGAYGAINGGFFAGTSSVSSIIYPNEVAARNLISVNRQGKTYPVIRSIFALNQDRSMAAEWVYHHSYAFDDIYIYDEPMPYACDDPNPLPVPLKADGYVYEDIAYGIGGGPMLIKNGEINITYCEEIFWGSGVYMTDNRPRTAVGYTPDNKAILFVTNWMMIGDMAELLLEIGCYEAMNLDGGGSTAMAAGGQSIYDQGRAVPSILAVVHTDSLDIPKIPLFEKTMDTSDEGVTSNGDWFATANEGFWESPSMLHGLATHDEYYDFPLNLPAEAEYEIYAWWTSHSNRAADTPFFITHADGVTEVAVDQSIGGSMWNLIGTFNFAGSEEESVRITAGATTNQFVVADGIRIVSYDSYFDGEVPGDANCDGAVNVLDIITMANYVTGNEPDTFCFENADVNGDGIVNLLDIILTVDIIQGDDLEPGTVTDIDGNVYQTVIIGDQEWMAENLRVTRYNNGEDIPTGLSDTEWENTSEGACAIFDHNHWSANGINSPEEMVSAYGKLYNWYAVNDSRGLCPAGWSVSSDDDWSELINYLASQGFPNSNMANGAGNALKSCRQVNSPAGGDCNTSDHPRWNSHNTHNGFDEYGFMSLPGGLRWSEGSFDDVGFFGYWWTYNEQSAVSAWLRSMDSGAGDVFRFFTLKEDGFSVRCIKD